MKNITYYILESILDNEFANNASKKIEDASINYQKDQKLIDRIINEFLDWFHKEFKGYKIESKQPVEISLPDPLNSARNYRANYHYIDLFEYDGKDDHSNTWNTKYEKLFTDKLTSIIKKAGGRIKTSVHNIDRSSFAFEYTLDLRLYYAPTANNKPRFVSPIISIGLDLENDIEIYTLAENPNDVR